MSKPIPEGYEPVAQPGMFNAPDSATKPIPEGYESASLPFTERISEYAQGAGQGLLTAGPTVTGAVAGLKLGMPLGPLGAVAGMVTGGIGGYYAGQSAEDAYKGFFPEPATPDAKVYREAGKTFGGSLPFAAAVPYLPR
jgi:hypothetical protein